MNAKDLAALEAMPLDELIARLRAERPDILAGIEEEGRRERDQQQDQQIELLQEEIALLREERAFRAGYAAGQQARAVQQPSLMDRIGNHTTNGNNGYHN